MVDRCALKCYTLKNMKERWTSVLLMNLKNSIFVYTIEQHSERMKSMTKLQNNVFQPAFIFSNGMVLQRDKKIPIWGIGKAGMTVRATLLQDDRVLETQSTQVKEDGTFYLELSGRCGSFICYSLVLECQGEKISYQDVLIGEVYLAAGQSNMVFPPDFISQMSPDFCIKKAPYPSPIR